MAAHDIQPRHSFKANSMSCLTKFTVSSSDMPDVLLAQITSEVLIDQHFTVNVAAMATVDMKQSNESRNLVANLRSPNVVT